MQLVTLDFETYYDPKFSLTKMTTMEYVRDERFKVWGVGIKIGDEDTEWYGEDEAEDAIRDIDWEDTALLCQNTPFDGYILAEHYGIWPAYYLDTAAMARGLYPGQPSSLKDLAERTFPNDPSMRKGEELAQAKGIVDLPPDIEEAIAGYCIQDVDLTYAIYQEIKENYPQSELDLIDLTVRMFCEPRIMIDRPRITNYLQQQKDKAEEILANAGVDRKVLSSNQQFAAHLESIGIKPPMKTSPTTGERIPAFGKSDKGWHRLMAEHPELAHLWAGRMIVKSRIKETRAQRFLDAARSDDYISVPLRYYAAHTGRFGGTEKLNMQNLPRGDELRKCLMAPAGHLLYVGDLSNIEARMLAWFAGQDELVEQFRKGDDIYSNFATKIYGRSINKRDDPTERFVGKTAILGLGYGMGAAKFKLTLESGAMGPAMQIDETEAMNVVNTYRTSYERIPMLWSRLQELLVKSTHPATRGETYRCITVGDKSLHLPNGMSLRYEDLTINRDGSLNYKFRKARETTWGGRIAENVIQALARIVITDAMLRLDKNYPDMDVVLTVHDEVIVVAPEDNPDARMATIIKELCVPPQWASTLPLDAEGGYDKVYSK
jgi:DNA polymerase